MIKYFCDKCDKELENCDIFTITVTPPEIRRWDDNARTGDCILCRSCLDKFENWVSRLDQTDCIADRPQGEWTCRDYYWHTAICSNCNKVAMFEEWDGEVMEYNYCPNYGARMKGADDEDRVE